MNVDAVVLEVVRVDAENNSGLMMMRLTMMVMGLVVVVRPGATMRKRAAMIRPYN